MTGQTRHRPARAPVLPRAEELAVDGGVIRRLRLMVPMRDGVQLATDVYWAGGDLGQQPPRPVLLERSPYDVRAPRFSDGTHANGRPVTPESGAGHFVARGYVVVRQDCRGRGGSEGTFVKYLNEAEDGVDAHAWLATQPWCDGRVATQGVSYSAHTQTAAASLGAAPMSAMIVDSGGFSNAWECAGRVGGAFELKQVVWAMLRAWRDRAGKPQAGPSDGAFAAWVRTWFRALPWRPGASPLSLDPTYEDFLFEQWRHESLDEFWTRPGLYGRGYYHRFPPAPMLLVASWYDPYVLSCVENFHGPASRHPSSMLVLGPWTHGARGRTYAGAVDFGTEATFDRGLGREYLQLKSQWLADALAGTPARPRVRYFLMGGGSGRRLPSGRMDHGGRWRASISWPPPGTETLRLHLTPELALAPKPASGGAITYDADPRDPVPSCGGAITSGEPLMSGGAFDQVYSPQENGVVIPLNSRPDVVSFRTPPLEQPLAVTGQVQVRLHLSSSAPDTDVAVKLVDVYPPNEDYPDGFAMNVTDGMLRCRFRDDPARPAAMRPGEIYPLTIRMPDTANLFAAGHRLRLDVSSSNFPRCDVNPNTGEPVMGARTFDVARNTIHTEGSVLLLDITPLR